MHYPHEEDGAGKIKGSYKTSKSGEYLLASEEIISLAKDVLSTIEYESAEKIAKQLTGDKNQKDLARASLISLVKPPPKRPIYYAQYELLFLPRWTRNALRYLGDYVDLLVKSTVYEKMKEKRIFGLSLGPAIQLFQKYWPEQGKLVEILQKYNKFLYTEAKHDFKLPANREIHRFTAREVVLTAFITMNIAERLTAISHMAEEAKNDKMILD
jgi:hypothetical protein